MADLIDRQAAIDEIEFGITYAKAINKETGEVKELFQASNDELRKAEDRIKQLPSAQPNLQPTCNQLATDCISRQAAIKAIENLQDCYNGFSDTYDKACIIGVIEEIPTAQVNTPTNTPTDTISRQAALDALCDNCDNAQAVCAHYPCKQYVAVEKLPSAQPETCPYWDRESNFCTLHRPSAQPERRYDEWCTDCKEYDKEKHCCPRFNHVIRTTLQEAQERKKGKWIIVTDSRGRHAECPYCGEWKYHSNQKFCGECGAQMEGEDE